MSLFVISYLAGVLTIASPCILPILPIVLARTDQPFVQTGLPMLFGIVVSFASAATLTAVAESWAVQANEFGRAAAFALSAVFALTLISSRAAAKLARPAEHLGGLLFQLADTSKSEVGRSVLLGVAAGLMWVPCAGPILGTVLTGAALQGASVQTAFLLADYAAGAATSMAVAMLAGGRVFAMLKHSLGVGQQIRRVLGVAVLASTTVIGLGLAPTLFASFASARTFDLEQSLLDRVSDKNVAVAPGRLVGDAAAEPYRSSLPVESASVSLEGAAAWLNSNPLSNDDLRGKVVLVDFWTYSCINCIRTLPYVRAWAEKYKDRGLLVIGVHTPEFAFEKKIENVEQAVRSFKLSYPVAIDSDYRIWRSFQNMYWPALYFIDAKGQVRHHQFGEGDYVRSEEMIQELLAEASGRKTADAGPTSPVARGAELGADLAQLRSEETYVGYDKTEGFVSPQRIQADKPQDYSSGQGPLNTWSLKGNWTIGSEKATLNQPDGSIIYNFLARDLHLVVGPGAHRRPIRIRVTIDGKPPGVDHGADVDAAGEGTVVDTRLYQLVRQSGAVRERIFEVRFLDPGATAYAFTFS